MSTMTAIRSPFRRTLNSSKLAERWVEISSSSSSFRRHRRPRLIQQPQRPLRQRLLLRHSAAARRSTRRLSIRSRHQQSRRRSTCSATRCRFHRRRRLSRIAREAICCRTRTRTSANTFMAGVATDATHMVPRARFATVASSARTTFVRRASIRDSLSRRRSSVRCTKSLVAVVVQ